MSNNRHYVHSVTASDALPFDAKEYSRFKHGDRDIAKKYGYELATKLLNSYLSEYVVTRNMDAPIFISGAPYNEVPVASTALAFYVATALRLMGFTNVKTFKISREHSYHQDYGLMSVEDRKTSITGETFHMDGSLVKGSEVIFVDDILITGAHESRIVDMIRNVSEKFCYTFAYYAHLEPNCCEPSIEHDLNSAALLDAVSIMQTFGAYNMALNTRATKYLLKLEETQFSILLNYIETSTQQQLYDYGIANYYNRHEFYKHNFKILSDRIYGLNQKVKHLQG